MAKSIEHYQEETMSLSIIEAKTPDQLDLVRQLFREYEAFLQIDLSFQDFEAELRALPGKYAPPAGALLLAIDEDTGDAAGCVAMRPMDKPGMVEMKRLFVRDAYRGRGVGKRLVETILLLARQAAYHTMRLDTLNRLQSAIHLYQKQGFQKIPAYYHNPLDGVSYWEKRLDSP